MKSYRIKKKARKLRKKEYNNAVSYHCVSGL